MKTNSCKHIKHGALFDFGFKVAAACRCGVMWKKKVRPLPTVLYPLRSNKTINDSKPGFKIMTPDDFITWWWPSSSSSHNLNSNYYVIGQFKAELHLKSWEQRNIWKNIFWLIWLTVNSSVTWLRRKKRINISESLLISKTWKNLQNSTKNSCEDWISDHLRNINRDINKNLKESLCA